MDTNNLFWNSLKDKTASLEYGLSSILLTALIMLYIITAFIYKQEKNNNRKEIKFFRLIVLCLLSAFLAIYITVGAISGIVENGNESLEASDDRFKYMTAGIGVSSLLFAMFFTILGFIFNRGGKDKELLPIKIDRSKVIFYTLIYTFLSYTVYSVIYVIYDMYKSDNFFPLYSKNYKEEDNTKINLDALLGSIFTPIIFFIFSIIIYLIFKFARKDIITGNSFYILLGLSLLFGSVLAGLYFSKTIKNNLATYSLFFSEIGLVLTTIFVSAVHIYLKYYKKNPDQEIPNKESEKYISAMLILSSCLLILWSLGASITYSIRNSVVNRDKEYSIYLTSTTAAIFFSITATLIFLLYTKDDINFFGIKGDEFNWIYSSIYYLFLLLSAGSLAVSIANLWLLSSQKIRNSAELDGTNFENYNEQDYELLNLGMTFGYLATTLVSFFTLSYLIIRIFEPKGNKDFIDFLTVGSGDHNKIVNFLIILFFSGFVALLCYYISYYSTTSTKIVYKDPTSKSSHDFMKYVAFPAGAILLFGLGELLLDLSRNDENNRSTFFPKLYKFFTKVFLIGLPITSLGMYTLAEPKFYKKLSDGNNRFLIFGNDDTKKALPLSNIDDGDKSIFNVKANFANYGNGLLLTGGETNLDIEAIRGIRYVSNQGGYFNFKYLDSDLDSFDVITKNNGVNVFNLATNDVAFGKVSTIGTEAFWVTVGENVGVTDSVNNTIFYNTKAGAISLETIPDIDSLNDWQAGISTFGYRGNGVVAGSISGNNRWVAVGQDKVDYPSAGDSFNTIKYSNDGITWVNTSGVSFSSYGNKVAFAPAGLEISGGTATDIFVAAGFDYLDNNHILYSNDGITWASSSGETFDGEVRDLAYGMSGNGTSGIWVAVGLDHTRPIKYSIDGAQNWLNADGVSISKETGAYSVTYNLNKNRFEVVGKKNKATDSSFMYTSTNGSSWSADNTFSNINEATAITYNAGVSPVANYGTKYDNIFYPQYNDNKYFFVKKRPNQALNYFNYIFYISVILLVIFFYISLYFLKNSAITNTAIKEAAGRKPPEVGAGTAKTKAPPIGGGTGETRAPPIGGGTGETRAPPIGGGTGETRAPPIGGGTGAT